MNQQGSAIEIRTSHNPLQWVFYFIQPQASVNGVTYPLRWGTQLAAFPPGQYHVKIWVPYLWGPVCIGETYIEVYPGHISGLQYETAFFTFQQSQVRLLGTRPYGS